MGGAGGISGIGGVGAVGPVISTAGAAPSPNVAGIGPVNSPAAVINISPQGFDNKFISDVAAIENCFKTLTDQLVAAAVLGALDNDDKNDQNKNIVSALIVAAAVQAYNNASGAPGGSSSIAVPGAGISVSITA